jgi:hypothetical protein
MKLNRLLPLLWVFPLTLTTAACPTRTIPSDNGDGMVETGGSVDSGSDRGGASGAGGTGGATGMGGVAGAGASAGKGGASATGGMTGTAGAIGTGGVTGQGGVNGTGGGTGAVGGAAGGGGSGFVSGYVMCGSVTSCPLASGGQCCYSEIDRSSACQGVSASCESVVPMGANPGHERTTIVCDSTNDCPSNEICCYSNIYVGSSTACSPAASCVDVSPPGPGGYWTYRRQVCDPSRVAPTECLSGTCQTATNYSVSLPPYLYLCL